MSNLVSLCNLPDSDSDEENIVPPLEKAKLFGVYIHVKNFDSLKAGQAHTKSQGIHRSHTQKDTSKGTKLFYNCKIEPRCAPQAYVILLVYLWCPNMSKVI